MDSKTIKTQNIPEQLIPEIKNRWSPRSFSAQKISSDQMKELLEAARWSASANNSQPWKYYYAFRGTAGFQKLWECLKVGNQAWTNNAAVILVATTAFQSPESGNPNPWAEHDLGLANAQLIVQATHQGIYAHMMAGFETEKAKATLGLEDHMKPVCMMALGYLGEPDQLEEPFKSRELSERNRKPLTEISVEF